MSEWRSINFGDFDLAPFQINAAGQVRNQRQSRIIKPQSRTNAWSIWQTKSKRGIKEFSVNKSGVHPEYTSADSLIIGFASEAMTNEQGEITGVRTVPAKKPWVKWLYYRSDDNAPVYKKSDFLENKKPQIQMLTGGFPPEDVQLEGDLDEDWYPLVNNDDQHKFKTLFHGPSIAKNYIFVDNSCFD